MTRITEITIEIKGLEDAHRSAGWVFRTDEGQMKLIHDEIKRNIELLYQELMAILLDRPKKD